MMALPRAGAGNSWTFLDARGRADQLRLGEGAVEGTPAGGAGPEPRRASTLAGLSRELELLRARAARGSHKTKVSLTELAKRVNEPRSTVHSYVTGRYLAPPDVLDRIVTALGAGPAELREWSEAWFRVSAAQEIRKHPPANRGGTPCELPPDVPAFTGRAAELDELDRLLAGAGNEPSAVVISAVAGTAGVGKTALAVHWGHRVAARFPDGQLYVNLRGFDPSGSVMSPAEAVRGFLGALAVPAQRIPGDLETQVALYRSTLAGKRVLVVLDNARDPDQVRPLLPGGSGCLVVVTSRNQLAGLVATHGAHPITVDLLSAAESRQLLAHRLGTDRLAAEPEAVDEVITGCARLPLALAIAAARAALNPRLSLRALADDVRDTSSRLDALDAGEPVADVRAVFSWSYQQLDGSAARMFRLLGLHPGPDIAAPAAASLAGISVVRARALLAGLAGAHLVMEPTPGRYASHDLLRSYAAELSHTQNTARHRRAALQRLLDDYLHTAHAAATLLNPHRVAIFQAPDRPHRTGGEITSHAQAMDWFTAEHATLVAAVHLAARCGFDRHSWQLAWTLVDFLDRRGHWPDWIATQTAALQTANRLADRAAQAHTHRGLGRALARSGRYGEARDHLLRAVDLFGELSHHSGQARTHLDLSSVLGLQESHGPALRHAEAALELYRATGELDGQARALNAIGWDHAMLGDYRRTLTICHRALDLHRQVGDQGGEAATWDSLGCAHHHLGQHYRAVDCYQRALVLRRELGDRHNEADALVHLGDAYHAAGDRAAARDAWRCALHILDALHHPDAAQVRAKLRAPAGRTR
jgi:tetratricopeptide (TPR) repeat protein